ncbi:YfhO family protein [Shimazuella sp. AN120528]|uniref:YfhO family protein n=1 Tax=Shimazuella soli TaxID=1892854 RepID=UPI001F0FF435|nr:YfhO family protein [Shimazuella soli]MCH5585136.1 YfhO family protein [Shimazuella soli]
MSADSNEITTKNPAASESFWLKDNKTYAMLLAIFLSIICMCISGILRGSFPFGDITRSVNDLGNQFVPVHTYYWDLLHGKAEGDLFYNWRSAFGTGFYADFVTYLSSPFELLVYFFPREKVNLAVYVITLLKLASAGAAMSFYLSSWKKGSWVFAGLLGASYALCGWAVDDSIFVPMWLDGLIAFPLICLVGHWALEGRRVYLGISLAALCWIANFYTAYMATIGAVIVILIRMFTMKMTARQRGIVLLRGAGRLILGIGIAMPLIYPILKATSIAQQTLTEPFQAVPWIDLLSRLFPATEGIGLSPSIFVGTPALLLAFIFLFQTNIALRTRLIWSITTLVVLLSFQWNPTQLFWHAFAKPNGSSFREAFIFCGLLTMLAWMAIHHLKKSNLLTLVEASILYGLLMAVTQKSPLLTDITFPLVGAIAVVTIIALGIVIFSLSKQKYIWGAIAISLIILGFATESSLSSVIVDQIRYDRFTSTPEWGNWHDQVRGQIVANQNWPTYRTETGTTFIAKNDPWLLGGQGIVYYSSLTMKDTTKLVTDLGFGWDRWGRGLLSMDNEVTDAIFSVGRRIMTTVDPDGLVHVHTKKQAVPPLVTVHADLPAKTKPTINVFLNHELFFGTKIYEIPKPKFIISKDTAPVHQTQTAYILSPQTNSKPGTYTLQTACKPGSIVYLYTPYLYGNARLTNQKTEVKIQGSNASIRAPIMKLGKAPSSGEIAVAIHTYRGGEMGKQPIACLNQSKFVHAVTHLQRTGATRVEASGHSITATLPKGSTGSAVISIPNAPGWKCSSGNGKAAQPKSFLGLIRIPLKKNASTVSCEYTPPGLWVGILFGILSLVITLLLPLSSRIIHFKLK